MRQDGHLFRQLFFGLILLIAFRQTGIGQTMNLGDDVSRPIPGVGHDYIHGVSETISPTNGNLHISIDLPVPKGRGLTIPFAITYDSGEVHHYTAMQPAGEATFGPPQLQGSFATDLSQRGFGWSNTLPYTAISGFVAPVPGSSYYQYLLLCPITESYNFYAADGNSHMLGLAAIGVGTHQTGPQVLSGCTGLHYGNATNAGTFVYSYSTSGGDDQVLAKMDAKCDGNFVNVIYPEDCQYAQPAFVVEDTAGTVYSFPKGQYNFANSVGTAPPIMEYPSQMEDRNGNIIKFSSSCQQCAGAPVQVTDSAGRIEIATTSNTGSSAIYTIGGLNYTLNYDNSLSANLTTGATPVYPFGTIPTEVGCGFNGHVSFTGQHILRSITLPNGQAYHFDYDSIYGLLNKITYPDGGWVQYTWGLSPSVSSLASFAGSSADGPFSGACNYEYQTPVVTQRQVGYSTSLTAARSDSYSYSTNWDPSNNGLWLSKSTQLTTTDQPANKVFTTVYNYTSILQPWQPNSSGQVAVQLPVESTVKHYDVCCITPTRQDAKTWQDQFKMTSQVTTWANSTSFGKTYIYGGGFPLFTTALYEYDYGQVPPNPSIAPSASNPGTATRTTVYSGYGIKPSCLYFSPQNYPAQPCTQSANALPAASATSQIVVYAGNATWDPNTNSWSGTRVAETDAYYDGNTTLAGSQTSPTTLPISGPALPLGTHDESNYGSTPPAGTGAAPYITRGNLTKLVRWSNLGASTTKTFTYDETGQVLSMTDPCGNGSCADMVGTNHTTTYAYTDSPSGGNPTGNSNAYLTQIIYPTPADGVPEQENFTYNYLSGSLASASDVNTQVTPYTYNSPPTGCNYSDGLNRLSEVDHPDGGKTTYCYNDAAASVTTSTLITSTLSQTGVSLRDGLGHVIQTQLTSDPDGTDFVDSSFDGMGNLLTKSNPHRAAASGTDGTSTFSYDVLGRTSSVIEQDGSSVSNTFPANCTTVTDEAGKMRKICTDALGRMTGVWEDPSGVNYETDYQYDALNNLTLVTQKGSNSSNARVRTFQYDSLSRLVSATNPESGQITYNYDLNGNLTSKIAPSPNQGPSSTSQVTTSYTYDVLNRLTGKSYSDAYASNPVTPTVLFGYDGVVPATGCTKVPPTLSDPYGVGRRTSMCDGSGATSWSHDPMGRITQDKRLIGGMTTAKNIDYSYYLDGSVQFLTTPPLKSIAYTPGGAGRPTRADDNGDSIHFVTNATYAPPGELASLTNGGTIFGAFSYNSRLQPLQIYFGTNSPPALTAATCPGTVGNIMHRVYNFSVGSGDNGNVLSIANCRDTTRTQNFNYDPLNRIRQAYSSGTQWGETFGPVATAPGVAPSTPGIDAWGNLLNRSGVTGKTNTEPLSCLANTSNQLTSCSLTYDHAGNVTNNGTASYIYDAENRLIWVNATNVDRYIYDGDGRRVEKCTAGSPTTACPTSGTTGTLYWRGSDGETLDESDLSGTAQEEYIFFNGNRIARRDVDSSGNTIAVHYYFSDHLGTHSVITNSAGTSIEQDLDFYPYGGTQHDYSTAQVPQNYKFTGKERDSESGLDNFGARYDASSMGRFMTPDPLMASAKVWDPQTWNRYAYALNNPLKYVDPTGMNEVTAAQCAQDKNCVTVNVNVIYDKNANDGKGLTDKQKSDFEKGQLQSAKDQYGNADIHLNVSYTAGALSTDNGKTTVSGLQAGALNVVVTDQVGTAVSGMAGKTAVSFINPNSNDLPHEMAHQFMGDTQGWRNWVMNHDPIITGTILNAITDIGNDTERAWMRNIDQHSGPLSYYPLASAFHHNAAVFQRSIQPTTKPQQ